jgi:hypothetical protein
MIAALLGLDEDGSCKLFLADAAGQRHAYAIRAAAPGLARWAVEIQRLDTGSTYRLREELTGQIRCSCPAATYRRRGGPACKHEIGLRALRAFLASPPLPAPAARTAAAG